MAEPTVKHFIVTRFFPTQGINYLYNILHVGFLQKQVELAVNNELKSLANQTNKNFEIVFIMNPQYFLDERYEFLFKSLKDASPVPVHFTQGKEYHTLVREAYDNYDFVILSRMDFDDFVHKDSIADVQSKVNECEKVLLYGYCKGYQYGNKILYHMFAPFKQRGHLGVLQSWIWESAFAKNLPFKGVLSSHPRAKFRLQSFLQQNGVEFSESMFRQNTTMDAYIYFRHVFSHFFVVKAEKPEAFIVNQGRPGNEEVTADEITRKQLEDDYGFTYELKSIE